MSASPGVPTLLVGTPLARHNLPGIDRLQQLRDRLPTHRLRRPSAALVVTVVNAVTFAVLRPGVPDLQAALARGAAAAHGVGLDYWFQWFGGGATPGQYSVITPWLSSWLSAPVVGALGTVGVTLAVGHALAGTRHRVAGTWVAVMTAGLSLWSGRIAFAVGLACAVAALGAVRERRVRPAMLAAVAAACSSPVCGAFLALAMVATLIVERLHNRAALAVLVVSGATLGLIALTFGSPGPQIFDPGTAILVASCSVVMLLARPARAVAVAAVLTALAAPVLFAIPNGLGSNLARMTYICLPVAVVATSSLRRRLAVLAVAPAVLINAWGAVHDVRVATHPAAYAPYYAELASELDRTPQLRNHRLEVVQSRSFHTASYALLDHAALATGWETQEQQAVASVLASHRLDATRYRRWLDDNAVGYVAFDRSSTDTSSPEYRLVRSQPAYLTPVWRGVRWTLYRVDAPRPIVGAPGNLVTADQAHLTVRVPCACSVPVQVRFSALLSATSSDDGDTGHVTRTAGGWTEVRVPHPGTWVLSGRS